MTIDGSQIWFVFNELSARVAASTTRRGRERMDDMVAAVATMMAGRSATFVTLWEPDLWASELAPGYTVVDWLSATDPDPRRLILTLVGRSGLPLEADEAVRDRFHLSEFVVSERSDGELADRVEARGLGAAYLFGAIGVSLRSEDRWSRIRIQLRHLWLDEACHEQADDVEALNLSESSQVERLTELQLSQNRRGLRGQPATLSERKEECFPHLVYGRDVDGHLQALPRSILPVVVGKLVTLDDASRAWRRDPAALSPNLPKCHSESEPTMQQFGNQRRFRDPKGEMASYKLHTMVGSAYRIHLRVIHDPRGIEIGYIGRHLDTVRHR